MNLLRVCVLFLAGLWANVFAQTPEPPEIAAKAYLLVDITASQVLAQRQADVPIEPASLTKLMTAYLVFDALRAKKNHPATNLFRE
jgi:serine-type D-Ala-D-Ala carboxypeptidase (penicillin-binding protein 5/6)